jgi:hypothetical protein
LAFQQLKQLSDIHRNAPRLIPRQNLRYVSLRHYSFDRRLKGVERQIA